MNSPNSVTEPQCLAGSWRKRRNIRKSSLEMSRKRRMRSILRSLKLIKASALTGILIRQKIRYQIKMSLKHYRMIKVLIETPLQDNLRKLNRKRL